MDEPLESPAPYGRVARLLHWSVALLFLTLIPAVIVGDSLPRGPARSLLFDAHRFLGMLVLPLALGRLAWRLFRPPPPRSWSSPWERRAAHAVHLALYAAMVLQPTTGYLMYALDDGAARLGFGVALPGIGVQDPGAAGLLRGVHVAAGWAVLALLALHLAAVAKHELVDRDGTLGRMLGGGGAARGSRRHAAVRI